jgi:hypothetical protein
MNHHSVFYIAVALVLCTFIICITMCGMDEQRLRVTHPPVPTKEKVVVPVDVK